MIFRVRAARAVLNFSFFTKPSANSFDIHRNTLNFRLLCNVQAGNAPPSVPDLDEGKLHRHQISVEVSYFKKIMENNPKYPDLDFRTDFTEANKGSGNQLVAFFRSAVNNRISGADESAAPSELTNDLTVFENDVFTLLDLIEVLHLLPKYCDLFLKQVRFEVKKISPLLEMKVKEVNKSLEDVGLMLTLLGLMRNVEVPTYVSYNLLSYVYRRYRHLTNVQLMEYFYITHIYKIFTEKETKFKFEVMLVNTVPELNIDEVAVLSYALFRSQVCPGSMLAEVISYRVLQEIETMNDFQTCVIFKCLKYSGRRRISGNLTKIFEKCTPIIDKFSMITAVHVAEAGVSVNVECRELFQRVWDRASKEFDDLRMKDIERLLLISLHVNFRLTEDNRFVQLILQRFNEENQEINRYPRSFLSLLKFLIMHDIYVENLIKFAMSNEYRKLLKQRYNSLYFGELVFIENSVKLERPQYNMDTLSVKEKRRSLMRDLKTEPTESSSYACNQKIIEALKEMYDKDSIALIKPLPHHLTSHVILCINKKNEPQKIGDKLVTSAWSIVKAPEDGNLWIAFVLLRWQSCLSDKVTPNLVTEAKLRQFRKAGYIPITAYNFLLRTQTLEETRETLRQAIRENIQGLDV